MTKAKKITTAVLGSFVEWYDIALIGALSTYINNNFFDKTDPITNLFNIFLLFAVGYLARPLGALFFGYYGDQYGRQSALRLSLILVSSATLLIGCLPTVHEVGLLATLGLVVLRFVQGFGSGGEHAGGILLLYEDGNEYQCRRANYAIIAIMSGLFFGFVAAFLIRLFFEEDTINNWAWRIPFFLGALLGIFGVVLRMSNVLDTPSGTTLSSLEHYKSFFIENKKSFLIASGIYTHSVAIFYTNYFFYPGYIEEHGLIASDTINEVRVVMAIIFLVLFLILGKNLNRENAYPHLKISSISTTLFIFPLHYAMMNYGIYGYCIAMGVLTVLNVIYLLPIAGLLSGLFSSRYRYTGVSLTINIVSSLFGGTAPLILTFLVSYFGSFFMGGLYLFITAMLGYLAVNCLDRESKEGEIYAR
jgi:MFS transporter, MHS family, proline/betaine transporter